VGSQRGGRGKRRGFNFLEVDILAIGILFVRVGSLKCIYGVLIKGWVVGEVGDGR
jgi:hypothetical protein